MLQRDNEMVYFVNYDIHGQGNSSVLQSFLSVNSNVALYCTLDFFLRYSSLYEKQQNYQRM